ncbi:MAG: stage II sporulation protein D [Oscillospiraceae bacterium]|nr:stage II sporulation protein D [Oscillospiraceae bacterium]
MRRVIICSFFAVALAFVLPIFIGAVRGGGEQAEPPQESAEAEAAAEPSASPQPVTDGDITFTLLTESGAAKKVTMSECLPLAVAGEMPASFESEALKAQAVALRTYIICCTEHESAAHPQADVCTDPACCAAFATETELREKWGEDYDEYWAKICAAVSATDGQYLVWQGEAILAAFHSSSLGATEDSSAVWGAVPYLVSVSTPESAEDVTNLVTTVEVSTEDFKNSVLSADSTAVLDGEPSGWLGAVTLTASGRVASVNIGGTELSGSALRSIFALRSTDFTLEYTGESFLFTVSGYGHGVGMSQYGADTMAQGGAGYAEILSHYYPDTELVVAARG